MSAPPPPPAPGAWGPIVSGPLLEEMRSAIRDLALALLEPSSRGAASEASLARGTAGQAVFHAYLFESGAGEPHAEAARSLLEETVQTVADAPIGMGLHEGVAGVGWALEHLHRRVDLSLDEEALENLDGACLQSLDAMDHAHGYDLISGVAGIGVYALERLPRPGAVHCLERIVEVLASTADRRGPGVAWLCAPVPDGPGPLRQPHHDLGVAHGVPGVIGVLGRACAADVATERARPLLDGAMDWLLRQRSDAPGTGSTFPRYLTPDGGRGDDATPGWCYGDPGVAAVVLLAARAVGQPAWEQAALDIGRAAAERVLADASAQDTCLCHGAAGLGHVFNRLFQATGEARLGEASRVAFRRLLDMRASDRGLAGFPMPMADNRGGAARTSLLAGGAGLGLALLGAATDLEPAWDRVLVTSIPVRS